MVLVAELSRKLAVGRCWYSTAASRDVTTAAGRKREMGNEVTCLTLVEILGSFRTISIGRQDMIQSNAHLTR